MVDRKKLIQLVHIGAARLFPGDEAARRAWQKDRTGHDSCRDMSLSDLENLVAELRRKGALNPPRRRYSPGNRRPLQRKLTALWIDMAKQGLIRDGSERALGRWCHRQTGKHSIDWLTDDEAARLVEALKRWRKRLEESHEA